jgi:hypothetical protein
MADQKISELTAATSFGATDVFPIVQSSETKKLTQANMVSSILATTVGTPGVDTQGVTEQGIREALTEILNGTKPFTAGAATAAASLTLGATSTEGLQFMVIDEDVVLAGAVAAKDLTQDVPTGAVILAVQANLDTAITATTAVKVGVGVAADPDKYGKTSALTQNAKIDTIFATWTVLSGAEDVQVYACDTAGAAAGTLNAGTVRVRIVYLACNSLDNT